MSLFVDMLKATVRTSSLPIALIKDAMTMGGMMTRRQHSYTADCLDDLMFSYEKVVDRLDRLGLD